MQVTSLYITYRHGYEIILNMKKDVSVRRKEGSVMGKNLLMVMMGGSGTRFGANIPKQFIEVAGKPIFSYIIEKYADLGVLDSMVIVCHESWVEYTKEWIVGLNLPLRAAVTAGGASRSESVRNGLSAAAYSDNDDVVLIHDATHPYVDSDSIPLIIEATRRLGGATLGECQYDTVYKMNAETHMMEEVIPRETIVSGASPEAFMFGRIWDVYRTTPIEKLEMYTSAGALALAYGIPMEVIPTNLINLKITYRHDMEVFQKLFHDYYF